MLTFNYVIIISHIDKNCNALVHVEEKLQSTKNSLFCDKKDCFLGIPWQNRTHNRNLGGSRYIHLTTGRFLRFESYFTIQKIQNLFQKCPFFALKIVKNHKKCGFFGTPSGFLPLDKGNEGIVATT